MSAEQQAQQEKARQQEEARQRMLEQIFSSESKERLNRIRLVKPEKVRQIEDLVIQMAQQHQLGGPVQDAQLVKLLEQVSANEKTEIKIARRGKKDEDAWDDDEEGW
jgi:DNA-binding TFAR19-related protein (PDSD5 family)